MYVKLILVRRTPPGPVISPGPSRISL
jgi:hypothetical protein